jgi:hypothetical protein
MATRHRHHHIKAQHITAITISTSHHHYQHMASLQLGPHLAVGRSVGCGLVMILLMLVCRHQLFYSMSFRIRDKSLFWTKSGWKNNWDPKILNAAKPINPTITQYISCRFDHHSFLRSTPALTQSCRPTATSRAPASNTSTATRTLSSS